MKAQLQNFSHFFLCNWTIIIKGFPGGASGKEPICQCSTHKRHCFDPCGSEGKASACNVGDLGSIPGWRRSPGEGNGNPLQYSCLENPMDGEAWWATVHGVAESDMTGRLHFHFSFQEDPLQEEMTTHSGILVWRIPRAEEPSGLQSMGWQRVGHSRAAFS